MNSLTLIQSMEHLLMAWEDDRLILLVDEDTGKVTELTFLEEAQEAYLNGQTLATE